MSSFSTFLETPKQNIVLFRHSTAPPILTSFTPYQHESCPQTPLGASSTRRVVALSQFLSSPETVNVQPNTLKRGPTTLLNLSNFLSTPEPVYIHPSSFTQNMAFVSPTEYLSTPEPIYLHPGSFTQGLIGSGQLQSKPVSNYYLGPELCVPVTESKVELDFFDFISIYLFTRFLDHHGCV
jgi:hypothetical protein